MNWQPLSQPTCCLCNPTYLLTLGIKITITLYFTLLSAAEPARLWEMSWLARVSSSFPFYPYDLAEDEVAADI